jgi:hypothetical protein
MCCAGSWIPVAPPEANRAKQIACDFAMYRLRHLTENFFYALKQFRRIATRCDKTDPSISAMNPSPQPHGSQMNAHTPQSGCDGLSVAGS